MQDSAIRAPKDIAQSYLCIRAIAEQLDSKH